MCISQYWGSWMKFITYLVIIMRFQIFMFTNVSSYFETSGEVFYVRFLRVLSNFKVCF